MSLKADIEKIFMDNTNYANPSQAVNQASSLNALSADLYTDSKRFIYELLQNADDSSQNNDTVKVWIKIFDDNLVIAHSGSPFTARDLQGICNVNNGTKKSDLTKTGYKGIGFKSVFGQSDKVTIYTKDEYFRFDASYSFEWKWEESKTAWETNNDRKFQFPWQIIPIYIYTKEVLDPINQFLRENNANVATIIRMKNVNETSQAVQNLSQNLNMFLFLKNICEINFDITESVTVKIDRTSRKDRITLQKGSNPKVDWLINTINLIVPKDIKAVLQDERNIPEKLLNTDSIELSLAAKVESDGITKLSNHEKLLYSYLPTDEIKYSLPVLVNTSFLTAANRESLHADSKWNQWIFKTIAIEIFKWISKLVNTEFHFQAYQLIPKETITDELGKKFNEGIKDALKNIPFVISREGQLIKIEDIIVDFTYLSEKNFIGEEPIKKYIDKDNEKETGCSKHFAQSSNFFYEFKKLGASCFEWNHLQSFLSSIYFTNAHTIAYNIELIKHFKKLCESDKVKDISKEVLMRLPFIWDHKNRINYPYQVCFPTADDQNWDNPNSELSFLHRELQTWLLKDSESRYWLESLGVIEKTDITYITQTIIPKIDSYVTPQNALKTIRDLFNLYKKGNLKEDLIRQLSGIKLLTQIGSLCPAKDCFLSDYYKPRLEIEKITEKDIFVCESYCENVLEKDEWKRFFKLLGVQEGITTLQFTNRLYRSALSNADFNAEYFETKDKRFTPFQSTFIANCFSDLATMNYIQLTENNPKFAFRFWSDYIENYPPSIIKSPAIAYWGYEGRPGRISGDQVENFVPWFIKNIQCIPTASEKCEIASSVLLNSGEIKAIAGKYLPVFDGPELSPDWKAFFNFRTSFELSDYLELLSKISLDIDDTGSIKNDNYKKIQSVYSALLSQCVNWSTDDIEKIEAWATTGFLLNTKNQFKECSTLKFFLDGNEAIFQEQYSFILLSAENRKNPNLEKFLMHFKVKFLRQSEFELIHTQEEVCLSLKNQLKRIIPYLKMWIENEDSDANTRNFLESLEDKIAALEIFQTEELIITYKEINFTKNVNIHFNETSLYVTNPWNANSVLLKLSDILCRYFHLVGHDKKLDFLLRSTDDEIQQYFIQEELEIPEEVLEIKRNFEAEVGNKKIVSFADIETAINEKHISPEFFHLSQHDYSRLKYIEQLITRAVTNVMEHLMTLPEYDCSHCYKITDSIIGGITKNGNEITVVARPSDNDQILIYYTSEFDVLEYVDAELWCEDGVNMPKQITMGQLLKKTGINRIPIKNIDFTDSELETLLNDPKSNMLDFNAVPFIPQKIAKIISSYANTNGGTLIFGLKEISLTSNETVGLSTDFPVVEMTKKAISLLSPIPTVTYDWIKSGGKTVFVIKTEKAVNDILLENQKYIREGSNSVLDVKPLEDKTVLSVSSYKKTIAIIIAIENYAPREENQVPKVKYATNDALKFKEVLIKSMGVDENDIYLFIDEKALKSSLEYDFKSLFYSLAEEDRLVFYYVGHGFHNGITNYLSTYDMHRYHITETAVSLRKILLDPLLKSKCKNALIFIDACAQSFQDENERSNITDISDEEIAMLTSEFPYYATFLSCQPGQSSYSSDILKNGIWTHHLVNAISGNVSEVIQGNKYITDRLLQDYLSNRVYKYTKKELGYDQNPKAILDSSHENVIAEIKKENGQ
ncbi:caspase family protein|uniref:Putative DNA-binding domain-containing protein n=1 Tax=Dendrosporobacter quercicolus TaxID=146817 RepID=A0A1G9LWB6_9FIRM|nr:caspase family protein [Dendrosporobacter quercicolus]NSL46839.1 caspase family protein [Dendrosporobacter quercicolus DSM 1736]SDL66017.1 Putative DNA-binding domain-containing protein [Dendrosporobacter quercicolus]